jgi:hypothetical protein
VSRGDGAVERALRPTEKEVDAQRITIECVEPPSSGGGGYIVCVTPKPSTRKEEKEPYSVKDIKRVFETEEATLAYIKKVL